jgi:thioredoxin-like negative regulator of GroEL
MSSRKPLLWSRYIPAVYGFRDGELLDFFVCVLPERDIKSWLERVLSTEAEQRAAEASKIAQIDPQGAEQRFREAFELDASLPKAKIGLAALLLAQGRLDECRELLEDLSSEGSLSRQQKGSRPLWSFTAKHEREEASMSAGRQSKRIGTNRI